MYKAGKQNEAFQCVKQAKVQFLFFIKSLQDVLEPNVSVRIKCNLKNMIIIPRYSTVFHQANEAASLVQLLSVYKAWRLLFALSHKRMRQHLILNYLHYLNVDKILKLLYQNLNWIKFKMAPN